MKTQMYVCLLCCFVAFASSCIGISSLGPPTESGGQERSPDGGTPDGQTDTGSPPTTCQPSQPSTAWVATPQAASDRSYGHAIGVDSQGNVYLAGTYFNAVTFGQTTLSGGGNTGKPFLALIDTAGKFVWAKTASDLGQKISTSDLEKMSIAIDKQDNAYWSSGSSYITRLDRTGQVSWSVDLATQGVHRIAAIALGSSGDLFVTGQGTIGMRLGSDGKVIWNTKKPDKIECYVGTGIALDQSDNAYIGCNTGLNYLKLDASGKIAWEKAAGKESFIGGLASGPKGGIYVAASLRDKLQLGSHTLDGEWEALVFKIDASGAPLWASQSTQGGLASPRGITVDTYGRAFITGDIQGKVSFGQHSVNTEGEDDIFLAQLSPNGGFAWAQRAGSNYVGMESERGQKLAFFDDHLFVVGWGIGKGDYFGTTIEQSVQTSFAWKLKLRPCQP